MTSVNAGVEHYLAEFSAHRGNLPGEGVEWVRSARERALDRFRELGFPTPRQEAWKYTRVTPIEKREFRVPAAAPARVESADLEGVSLGAAAAHRLVFVDGRFDPSLSTALEPSRGVRFASMASALADPPAALRAHLGRYADGAQHAFCALNTAFMADGAYIHVEEGALAGPIELVFIASLAEENSVAYPRVLIVAEPGSRVSVLETYASLAEGCHFTDAVTELAVEAGATVDHYKVQQESTKAFHVATLDVRQQRDSSFRSHSVSFGAQLARNDINVVLDDEGVDCVLNGLFLAEGRQHVDYHTRIDHAKPRGVSRESYRGILGGRSRGVFDGLIKVRPNAQETDAQQSSNNLLLSRNAEIDTKPQLEIYADDVKCAHGATVGQLDENMLFYLRSRGIPLDAARGLLTYGFAKDILDRIELVALREKLTDALLARVPDAQAIRGVLK